MVEPALFSHAQDQVEMAVVMRALKELPLWRWMAAAFKEVFSALEFLRRWGMVCECPEHRAERKRAGGKQFIKCPRIHDYQITFNDT